MKNWLILNIHPEGSDLSKRGTSNFILGRWEVEGTGEGMVDEEEGDEGWC